MKRHFFAVTASMAYAAFFIQPVAASTGATDEVHAQVFFNVAVQRKGGEGTCGKFPYGVDNIFGGNNSCQGPKYWFTYALRATAFQNLDIHQKDDGSWLLKGSKPGGGTYQLSTSSDDGKRICRPTRVQADNFDFDFAGRVQNRSITYTISALPLEISDWKCRGGNGYQRETTLLLIHWANALSGDFRDLSGSLSNLDLKSPGEYSRVYNGAFNPSPENRDSVEVKMDLSCRRDSDGQSDPVSCPWEAED